MGAGGFGFFAVWRQYQRADRIQWVLCKCKLTNRLRRFGRRDIRDARAERCHVAGDRMRQQRVSAGVLATGYSSWNASGGLRSL